jgi:crotonobetainyl-CoA:carnitine CoA-transferase CaiB-like acyl-CoA transferase
MPPSTDEPVSTTGSGSVMPALRGIRILDLSRVLAGPLGTMVLADLGADVIKVERVGVGDDLRAWGPPFTGDGESAYFLAVNRNKRSITLDLKHPRGRQLLRDLARHADVLVENFRVGTMDELGVGWDALREDNPRLVYCALSAFGTDGPYRDLPGYDLIIQAMGGLMSVTGDPDGEPMRAGVAVVDVIAGLYVAIGVLAALRDRERTGIGQRVDLSLLGVELASLVNVANNYLIAGALPSRLGNAHPSIAPYEVYPTADGHVAVAVATEAQWRRFGEAVGASWLVHDPRVATNGRRVEHRAWLTETIAAIIAPFETDALVARLRAADVPCGPVNTIDRILDDPHVAGQGLITRFRWADETLRVIGSPLQFSGSAADEPLPPPRLGQDTEAVLSDLLGLGEEVVEELRRDGVV